MHAAPNHHARHHHSFAGVSSLVAGLTMIAGRGGVAKLAADLTDVGPDDHVVDVGCGPGSAARFGARRAASAIGVDPASVMVTLARRLILPGRSIRWMNGTDARADNHTVGRGSVLAGQATR